MTNQPENQLTLQLAPVLSAMRAVSTVTRKERLRILREEGPGALGSAVFGDTLLDPVRDDALAQAEKDLMEWASHGYRMTGIRDSAYPAFLQEAEVAPPILYSIGDLVTDDLGVSVIGSRDAGPADLDNAARVARELVGHGLTVVSGLAAGIDAAAHTAALEEGGRTVAVMGTGLDHTYPAQNRELRSRIEETGLVLSQFEPPQSGAKWAFPLRNAVMSGYSTATVIVVAGEKSGTRHQAQAAVEQGRTLVLTPTVAARTTWGRRYVDGGAAQVAHSPGEVAALVLQNPRKDMNDNRNNS